MKTRMVLSLAHTLENPMRHGKGEDVLIAGHRHGNDESQGLAIAQALQAQIERLVHLIAGNETTFVTIAPRIDELLLLLPHRESQGHGTDYDYAFVIGAPNHRDLTTRRSWSAPYVQITRVSEGSFGEIRRLGNMVAHVQADGKDPDEIANEAINAMITYLDAQTRSAG